MWIEVRGNDKKKKNQKNLTGRISILPFTTTGLSLIACRPRTAKKDGSEQGRQQSRKKHEALTGLGQVDDRGAHQGTEDATLLESAWISILHE